jgi:hypothetical protein
MIRAASTSLLGFADSIMLKAALTAIFADQAHLTRVLRCRLGSTPAQLRRGSRD